MAKNDIEARLQRLEKRMSALEIIYTDEYGRKQAMPYKLALAAITHCRVNEAELPFPSRALPELIDQLRKHAQPHSEAHRLALGYLEGLNVDTARNALQTALQRQIDGAVPPAKPRWPEGQEPEAIRQLADRMATRKKVYVEESARIDADGANEPNDERRAQDERGKGPKPDEQDRGNGHPTALRRDAVRVWDGS